MAYSESKRAAENRWNRQEEETTKAFQAFTVYRDLPPDQRSLTAVAQTLRKQRSLCARWSARFQWINRVTAWDEFQDEAKRKRAVVERQKMYERQQQHNRIASQALAAPLIALAKLSKANPNAYAGVSATELTKIAALAARALPRIHEDERTTFNNAEPGRSKELQIVGAEFAFVESNCADCGHAWGAHEPEENGSGDMLCQLRTCTCKQFRHAAGDQ